MSKRGRFCELCGLFIEPDTEHDCQALKEIRKEREGKQ